MTDVTPARVQTTTRRQRKAAVTAGVRTVMEKERALTSKKSTEHLCGKVLKRLPGEVKAAFEEVDVIDVRNAIQRLHAAGVVRLSHAGLIQGRRHVLVSMNRS